LAAAAVLAEAALAAEAAALAAAAHQEDGNEKSKSAF
jgi:hypothetical protein